MKTKVTVLFSVAIATSLIYAYSSFDVSIKRKNGAGIPVLIKTTKSKSSSKSITSRPPSASSNSTDNWQPVINSNGFYQGVDYFTDNKRLVVMEKEWNFNTQAWDESSYQAISAFEIAQVSTSGVSDNFFVAGKSVRNGAAIIEHWIAVPTAGGTSVVRNTLALPLQTPAPIATAVPSIVGGVYEPPFTRPLQDPVERIEIYRGLDIGDIWDIAPDPNERILLILAVGGSVYQIDLLTGSDPVEVLSATMVPDLALMTNLYVKVHPTFGVCYITSPAQHPHPIDRKVVVYDYNNDGVIDHTEAFSRAEFRSVHENQGEDWIEDMLNYYE